MRIVSHVLCSVCHQQTLNDEDLNKLFCAVEAIVHNRPLTTVSSDQHDAEALTPHPPTEMKRYASHWETHH